MKKKTTLYFAVVTAAINAFVGLMAFVFNADAGAYIRYLFLGALILVAPGFYLFKDDFAFQLRQLFLLAIGYFAAFVKAIDNAALFSPVGLSSSELGIAVQMFGLTSIAFFGALLGLIFFGPGYNGVKLLRYSGVSFDPRFASRLYILAPEEFEFGPPTARLTAPQISR